MLSILASITMAITSVQPITAFQLATCEELSAQHELDMRSPITFETIVEEAKTSKVLHYQFELEEKHPTHLLLNTFSVGQTETGFTYGYYSVWYNCALPLRPTVRDMSKYKLENINFVFVNEKDKSKISGCDSLLSVSTTTKEKINKDLPIIDGYHGEDYDVYYEATHVLLVNHPYKGPNEKIAQFFRCPDLTST